MSDTNENKEKNIKESCKESQDISDNKESEQENNIEYGSEIIKSEESNLKKENFELKNRIMLLIADMENLRRRTKRDIEDAKIYSISNFSRDILSVLDNLERAINLITDKDKFAISLIDGVQMTKKSMLAILQRYGIKKIEINDKIFNPNFHQAMFEVERTDIPAGIITEIIQEGYIIEDRILRPTLVGVSKCKKIKEDSNISTISNNKDDKKDKNLSDIVKNK